MKNFTISVDIGGTFTDIVGIDESGNIFYEKVNSTPDDQSIGLITGVNKLLKNQNQSPDQVAKVAHGTTVATNTMLERSGEKTALITTEGFRDVLFIGRQNRPDLYELTVNRTAPLIPRHWRVEVVERTLYTGEVQTPLDEEMLRSIIRRLEFEGIQSIAVCFLHAYINSENERKAKAIIQEAAPSIRVTLSSDILPVHREFERTITSVINAYVQPKMEKYIMRLRNRLNESSVPAPLLIMKSSGGMMTDAVASSNCVYTLLSGPAGGALAAEYYAANTEHKNLITCDMGGTSFDVSVISNGKIGVKNDGNIEGFPINFPHIDITTIGEGGGSVAWIDNGGALRVGPRSAGAFPGPVCYEKGGTEPTITDANLVLGYLGENLVRGDVRLNVEAARLAIKNTLSEKLGMTIEEVAEGILRVANATMIRAIRKVTVERGIDPRNFVAFPYGGAGPLHSVELARSLNINKVVVPIAPGNFSALGLLIAPIRYDEVITYVAQQKNISIEKMQSCSNSIAEKIAQEMERDGVNPETSIYEFSVDLRYYNQDFSLNIPIPNSAITEEILAQAISDFHKKHLKEYGFMKPEDPIEIVCIRLSVINRPAKINLLNGQPEKETQIAPEKTKKAYFRGEWMDISIYDREKLPCGSKITGPAVIEELGSTTLIGPGDVARIDGYRSIVIDVATLQESETALQTIK